MLFMLICKVSLYITALLYSKMNVNWFFCNSLSLTSYAKDPSSGSLAVGAFQDTVVVVVPTSAMCSLIVGPLHDENDGGLFDFEASFVVVPKLM